MSAAFIDAARTSDKARIGVAMCTFNGERHLLEQLESIAAQSRLPDVLFVNDDGSSDRTVVLLERFASHAPFPISVVVNSVRLGSVRNFEKTLGRVDADLVALADQDDVWESHKLATLEREFTVPEVQLAFSDALLIDADGAALPSTMWEAIGVERRRQTVGATALSRGNSVTGALTALRRDVLDLALPFPGVVAERGTPYHHDGWLALAAASRGAVLAVPELLVRYRLHDDQQVGLGGHARGSRGKRAWAGGLAERRWLAARSVEWLNATLERFGAALSEEERGNLQCARLHFERRAGLPASRVARLPTIAMELASRRYGRHAGGWRAAALDATVPAQR